jgi:PleD family two-component response regulator
MMHWREKQLIGAIQEGKLSTSEVVSRVNMSKVTALKYLEILSEKGLIECEKIGPTKLWSLSKGKKNKEKIIKILIADDDINVINIITDFLETDQFEILVAENGKEALGMAFSTIPNLILLDIMMPNMDGYQVCGELKKNDLTKDIPIIILSAKNSVEDKIKAMKLGINDYISKPFDLRELEARIKMILKVT